PDWFNKDAIGTVIVAFPDVYGRLLGKRMTYDFFVDHVLQSGWHACTYLLTTDLEMNVLPGFELASWESGFGDFLAIPDLLSLCHLPWHHQTALVLCDLFHAEGSPVIQSPRAVLRSPVREAAELGMKVMVGSELEFVLFNSTFETIAEKGHRELVPSSDYLIDYHILQPGREETILERIRTEMSDAGILVECSKGEAGRGQHEVNLVFQDAMSMADQHAIYKIGAKQIAAQEGKALSFMAKWTADDAGSGFHLHLSLWNDSGTRNLFWDSSSESPSDLFHHFLGGLLRYSRELTYFFAPTVNSYKRFQPGSWAPTAIVASIDNRTCGYRVVGHGESLRIENRMPGADANPYLAFAATLAAGLEGIRKKLPSALYVGNA
ncbi:glutamine synthetase, partial [Candidatus Bipolaricaulota bacterium]|nr:glutamine synthetase [Candidatus Bipolaricaulota bacterium]